MFNIAIYLDKFKKLESKSSDLKNIIIDSINNVLKVSLNKGDVEVKNGIIHLKVNPVVRNEMFINKTKLIKDLSLKNITIKNIL